MMDDSYAQLDLPEGYAAAMIGDNEAGSGFIARANRFSSDYVCEVAGPTIATFHSRIANISASGMLIEQNGTINIGDVVHAFIPGNGNVPGRVVRKRDRNVAIKFFDKLNIVAFCQATRA